MKRHCDLLPDEFHRETLFRRRLFQWSIVWVLGAIGIAIPISLQAVRASNAETERDVLAAEAEPLRSLVSENTRLDKQIRGFETKIAELGLPATRSKPLGLLQLITDAIRAADNRVVVERFEVAHELVRKKQKTETRGTLVVSGFALDDARLAKFVAALRQSGHFAEVQFSGSNERMMNDRAVRSFSLRCVRKI